MVRTMDAAPGVEGGQTGSPRAGLGPGLVLGPGLGLALQDVDIQNEVAGRDATRLKSNMIRVFVSSTLTDMSHERRALHENVTPQVLEYCRTRGLHFEMVDPCWGLLSIVDQEILEVLDQEIRASRRLSRGPSFIALLGDRYGPRLLPCRIADKIFQLLLSHVSEPDELALLHRWFIKDANSIPPVYMLQAISTQFLHYDDFRPEVAQRRNKSLLAWRLTETQLLQVLRGAASKAEDGGDLTAEQTRDFYTSVLERELDGGIFLDPGSSVLAIMRESPRQPEAPRRLSRLLRAALDAEGRAFMSSLKSRLLLHAAPRLHLVQLVGGGSDPRRPEHTRYLSAFCREVTEHLEAEINLLINGDYHGNMEEDEEEEARFHNELCTQLAEGVCGRDQILEKLHLVMKEIGASWHCPLVVHGGTGMGKTALLCRLAHDVSDDTTTMVVVRLLAARHPLVPDIDDVLNSVSVQVCRVFKLSLHTLTTDPAHRFIDVLTEVSRRGRKLILILDSLDCLSERCYAKKLRWLPARIPPNVHLLLSADDGGAALANARLKLGKDCLFHVGQLGRGDCERVAVARLAAACRTLTAEQGELMGQTLEAAGCPLHIHLAAAAAARWTSFSREVELHVGADVRETVTLTMLKLEKRHGKELVGGALGYLVLAREGLLETELRDLLSLDDDVISEVYRHSPPPSPSLIRLPPLLWSQLRLDLQGILEERWTRGTALLAFASRRVSDLVSEHYLTAERRGRSHRILADYFLGRWAGKLKPASLPGLSLVLSDRKVPPQPLWFSPNYANIRKLTELPYHLLHGGMLAELQQEVVGSADYLFAKTRVCGVSALVQDLDHVAQQLDCTESGLIRDALDLMRPGMDFLQGHIDASLFYTELLARLSSLAVEFPAMIGRLCAQCEERLLEKLEPVLIPRVSFLEQPGGALAHTLTAKHKLTELKGGVVCLDVSVQLKMLAAGIVDGGLLVWSLADQQLIHMLVGHTESILSVRVLDSLAHLLSLAADGSLRRWSLIGGEQLQCIDRAGPVDVGASTVHLHLSNDLLAIHTRTQVKVWAMDGPELRPLSVSCSEGAELVLGILADCVVSVVNFSRIRVLSVAGGATETAVEPAERQLTPDACVTLANRGSVLVVSKQGFLHQISASGKNSSAEFPINPTLLKVTDDEKVLLAGAEFVLCLFRVSVSMITLFLRLRHDDVILSACVSPDGRLVATGAADQLVRIWSVTTGSLLDSLIGSNSPVTSVHFYYNFLLSATVSSPEVLVWNTKYDTRHRPTPRIPAGSAHSALTQDGDRVYYVRDPSHMEVCSWSSQTGSLDLPLAVSAAVSILELLQIKRLLLCGLDGGTVLMFPLAQPQETLGIPPPEGAARVLALVADVCENCLAVAYDDAVRLFTLGNRDGSVSVEGPLRSVVPSLLHGPLTAMSLLAGERLLYGTVCGEVALCDFLDDGVARELEPHGGAITCVVTSGSGTHVLVGSEDAVQRLWALEPLTLEHSMEYKGLLFSGILCASFSDCNRFVFTGSNDGTIKIWDVNTGGLLYVQYLYSPVVRVLAARSGLVALTRQGSVVRETFRCPDQVSPDYNPLRNVGNASYCVTSRDKAQDQNWDHNQDQNRAYVQDFNPAQLHQMSMHRAKPSATCCLF